MICQLFSREHEILREEVRSLQDVRSRLQTRITELEEELKKVKQEAEEKAKANKYAFGYPLLQFYFPTPFLIISLYNMFSYPHVLKMFRLLHESHKNIFISSGPRKMMTYQWPKENDLPALRWHVF